MFEYKKLFPNREFRLKIARLLSFIPTKPYLKMVYRMKTGRKLNLKKPVDFNEKLQWLKIFDKHSEYTELCDKVKVREHVRERLGDGYTFPLLGTWDSFKEIDFERLPESFVLKCNHDSGSVKIVRNKSSLTEKDIKELSKFFKSRLRTNLYYLGREYQYKDIRPCILAEPLMCPKEGSINDYKFFCFHGEPKIMFVATDRETDVTHTLFDMDFNRLPINYVHKQAEVELKKPDGFEEMKEIAKKLSKGIRFVRIDLYEIDKRIYFGEYTFSPAGGFFLMKPDKWEKRLGEWIDLRS